jgi:DNA invertase Pin-like site-specific DNA recombinase
MLLDQHRAAQYIRMSTDMQRYSLKNQREAIGVYAVRRGLTIVRSYEDAGRSGLRLDGRAALKQLIDDVKSGCANYRSILVYDVSRWGRFQDSDESAHYEFICKEAGVAVCYCAEEFENDGSLMATIVKNIKRAMAGEFSRELSVKVHAGQSRMVAMGFHVGGNPGFGLRRCLLDERGDRKFELASGQRKNLHTEHTILVPGSSEEVKTVHYVYRLFVDQKRSLSAIVRLLNAQGLVNRLGRPWSFLSVRELLSNEKYMGNSVYNRTSRKLGTKMRRNPKSEWVRKVGAFEPVISAQRFAAAQRQLKENASHYTDNEMLDFLTALWCREKHLSRDIVEASKFAPTATAYKRHFGTLVNAFRRVGFTSARIATLETLRSIRKAICNEIASHVPQVGGTVEKSAGYNSQLRINGELNVTIVVGRTSPGNEARKQNAWQFGYRSLRKPDLLIVARVDQGSFCIRDYYVIPYMFLPAGTLLTISGVNYQRLEAFRSQSLAPFYALCARTPLHVASA